MKKYAETIKIVTYRVGILALAGSFFISKAGARFALIAVAAALFMVNFVDAARNYLKKDKVQDSSYLFRSCLMMLLTIGVFAWALIKG